MHAGQDEMSDTELGFQVYRRCSDLSKEGRVSFGMLRSLDLTQCLPVADNLGMTQTLSVAALAVA